MSGLSLGLGLSLNGAGPPPDIIPDAFTFTDQTGVEPSTVTASAAITTAGLTGSAVVTVTGGEYRKNGGSWTSSAGTAVNGDQFEARHTSSASYSTATNTVLTIGGVSDTFTSTTRAWTYTDIANLEALYWAEAQAEAADAEVATLLDRSGNGWDFPKLGTGALLRHNYVNGKKALHFNGATPCQYSLADALMDGATEGCYFAVVKVANDPPGTAGVSGPVFGNFKSSGGGNDTHFPYTDGKIYEGWGQSGRAEVNPTPSLASWCLYLVETWSGGYRMEIDGVEIFTTGTNTVDFGTGKTRYIGRQAAAFFLDGHLALAGMLTARPGADKQRIYDLVEAQYGITLP
jgi:hypothetical protein